MAKFIGSPAMNLIAGEVTGTGAQTTVKTAQGGVVVSNVPTNDSDLGMVVNIGVRPEDLISHEGEDFVYSGKVNIVEALGEVTVLYFEPSGSDAPVIAKLPGIHRDVRGTDVRLSADPAKVHLFHQGQSLLYR